MKLSTNRQSLRTAIGTWSLLLALLMILAGCNLGEPPVEGTDPEQTTARVELPKAPNAEDPDEDNTDWDDTGENNTDPVEEPAPIAPPSLVTKRFVGRGDAGAGSGTFYNGDHWFYATVLEVTDNAILVSPYQNAREFQTAEQILVNTTKPTGSGYTVPEFCKDSLIMVVYDGVIITGNPARILAPVRFESYVHGFGMNGMDYFCAGAYKIGYFSNAAIYSSRLNKAEEGRGTVYHITSVEELKELLDLFVLPDVFSPQIKSRCYMEDFILSTYGEEYFAENDLIVSYLTASSGSYRFSVEGVTVADGMFSLAMEEVSVLGVTVREEIWNAEE
ncbi:MAG: hypothetical protein IJX62_02545 [Clostridia bacterium]|nr:hypothetical protein [Clostridia bacterium]